VYIFSGSGCASQSVVLHDLKVNHVASTFPVSLGAKVSGVDDNTFTATGEAFSMVVLPNSESPHEKTLQSDDVSLAYEFAKKVCYLPVIL
jgi:hypothetical protein